MLQRVFYEKLVQSNLALRTPTKQGHPSITDGLLYGWGKKAITFSLNSTNLKRAPNFPGNFKCPPPPPPTSVSVLTGFDCTLLNLSANGLNHC